AQPTTWIWEGVVMYLEQAAIEATLAVIQRRSASGSRIVVAYHAPAWKLHLIGLVLKRVGEPLRSAFTPDAMRALLAKYEFRVVSDEDVPTIGSKLSPTLGRESRFLSHMRIVTADRG
ncbi:MAG TPA: class I SAM-dependent methyltransferase, partial [Kofleriaceae bacterium]|nr:class I SAM-dependent methyltransferase [Kofleriaceae bacterium]